MKICKKCGNEFPLTMIIDGKKRNLQKRKYCLTCSKFGGLNRRDLNNRVDRVCLCCGKRYKYMRSGSHTRFCSACNTAKKHLKRRKQAIREFGGKCILCGYDKCEASLDFHHIKGKDATPAIAIRQWKWERAKKELEKCILVCSNCHRELHYQDGAFKREKLMS